jgi:hypothetical protein
MKILVLHSGSSEDELKQLRQWLEGEACEVLVVDLSRGFAVPDRPVTELIADVDAIIVLIDSRIPLSDVHIAILAAHAKGKKIIAVKLVESILIVSLEKYGSSSVLFSKGLIVDAVCEDRFMWTDEDGDPREEPETKRHKCKKPVAKNAAA